jgi:hypothetical protein
VNPTDAIDTSGITFAAQEAPYLEGEVVEETKPQTFKLSDPDVEEKLKALFDRQQSELEEEEADQKTSFYTNRAARRAVIKANRRRR